LIDSVLQSVYHKLRLRVLPVATLASGCAAQAAGFLSQANCCS